MTTAVAQQRDTVKDLFLRPEVQKSLADVLPRHMTPDRLAKVALVEIAKNPALGKCNPHSLLKCLMQAGELGLDFGGVLGQAYMVPYKTEATFIVGYRGLINLARRSGNIQKIAAYCVYAEEPFKVTGGIEGTITHEIDHTVDRDPKNIVAAYAVAQLKDGSHHFEVMSRSEIEAIRRRSRAGGNGPWVTDFGEMAKKTVVRRLAKYLPLSPEDVFAKAVELDQDRVAATVVTSSSAGAADLNALLEDGSADADDDAEAAATEDPTPTTEAPEDNPPCPWRHVAKMLARRDGCDLATAEAKLERVISNLYQCPPDDLDETQIAELRSKVESGAVTVTAAAK